MANTKTTTGEFQIEFLWQDIPYIGIVTPIEKGKDTWYTIQLESENQETYMELTMRPSLSAIKDWDFFCGGDDAEDHYDPDLLLEVAEAIEKYLKDLNGIQPGEENEVI